MRAQLRLVIDATLQGLRQNTVLSFDAIPHYSIEVPRDPQHGDFSCNVAMVLTKATGKKSIEIADAIIADLIDTDKLVTHVEKAGPGFLNFRLSDRVFQRVAREVLSAGDSWGRQVPKSTGKKVLVEFVSANPTGPIHIGHARGAFMGDAVARLLDAAGHDVTCEYYNNDYGKQVETLGRTVHKRYRELFGEKIELAPGEYPAPYVIEIARSWKNEVGDKYLNAPESEWMSAAMQVGIRENMKAIVSTLDMASIRHDHFFSEASLHASGKVNELVDVYRQRGVTYDAVAGRRKDQKEKVRNEESKAAQYADRQVGGTFLMTSRFTDEKGKQPLKDDEDRIILRADGTPVYLTSDLAYHRSKFERGFDLMVDVLGADHAGHVPRIESGMALLGYDAKKLKFLLVQMVRITRGGEEVKVSKRKGTVFELAELIEEAGADVCRFIFLMKTRDAHFDFDLDLVTRQSKDNPVFYFQYGHARCASILRKAAERGIGSAEIQSVSDAALGRLTLPEEKVMLKKMSQLADVVTSAAEKLEPHHVLYFCQELIGDFHSYYTKYKSDPVLSSDPEKTLGRLAMVAALKQTLKSAFAILGVQAPDQMDAPPEDEVATTSA